MKQQKRVEVNFRSWALANVVGFGLAGIPLLVGAFFAYMVGLYESNSHVWISQAAGVGAIAGAVSGLLIGICQLISLRHVVRPIWWVLGAAVSVSIGYAATTAGLIALQIEAYQNNGYEFFAMGMEPFLVFLIGDVRRIIVALIPGLLSGVASWLLLRRRFARAWWWPLTHVLSWLIAIHLILVATGIINYFVFIGETMGGAVTGAISGLIYASLTMLTWRMLSRRENVADAI